MIAMFSPLPRTVENLACERGCGLRQGSATVFENDLGEFLGGIGFACLKPVNGASLRSALMLGWRAFASRRLMYA